MGRPWWYDSYDERAKPLKRRRFRFPRGRALTWLILLLAVAVITWLRVKG